MHILFIYVGIFIGIFLEGELVMISSVIAAHHHYLNIWVVLAVGIAGTFSSDLFYFNLGRKRGQKWLDRRSSRRKKFEIAEKNLQRYPVLIFLAYRFAYGFRAIIPFVIGSSHTRSGVFYTFSAITTLVWAAAYGALGYLFGEIIQSKLSHIEHIEKYIIGVLALLGVILIVVRRQKEKHPGTDGVPTQADE